MRDGLRRPVGPIELLEAETAEIEVDVDMEKLFADFGAAMTGASGPEDAGRRLGTMARAAPTVDPAVRRAAVDARLPVKAWPNRNILLPAVDAETGALTLFSRGSGVALVDAVAASCAVPGVWPPVAIGGRRYIDGGARSITNAHLAAGAGRVLIIQPSLEGAPRPWGNLDAEIAALAPAAVYVISADQASVDAFGANPLSPSTRAPGGPRRPEPAAPSAPLRPQDWRPCGNKLGPEHTTQSVPTWVAIDAARGSRVRSPGVTR